MGTRFYLGCCLAFCLGISLSASSIPDEDVDKMLHETDLEVREWFESKPTEPGYANFTTRSYRKRAPIEIHNLGIRTAVIAHTADRLAKRFNIEKDEADVIVQRRASLRPGFNANDICNRGTLTCDRNNRYRNVDGSCNNLNNFSLGMAVVRFDRFRTPPAYSDGNGGFRRSVPSGEALLSPRIIRLIVHPDISRTHATVSHMVVGFGQFLDHDITSTPEGQNLQCCNNRNNPECMPIMVPTNDDFYSQFGVQCIDIARSVRACGPGQREQINQATAFIDGSQVYGNSLTEQNNLRAPTNGLLLTDTNNRLLPKDNALPAGTCGIPNQGITCFKAGDDRLNENPGLTSMHTIWLREHNRIATGLRVINPGWSNEILFQESKRIVIAEMQNVVFSQYLPTILGSRAMNIFNLTLPLSFTGTTRYDPNAVPVIFNEFATAAYRFGHTLIQNRYEMTGNGDFPLENAFQNPQVLYQDTANIDRIMLGFSNQAAQGYENWMSQAVTNHLFQTPGNRFGSDLAALNIQRGRDHGLQTYNNYRDSCRLPLAGSFDDLNTFFVNQDSNIRFRDAYRTVNDIDLWPAGISERPVPGGVVGDTFACIIGEQFKRLLYGDRMFFTHAGQAGSFTTNQLNNLRQRTLASVICDNASPTVASLQQNVFLLNQPKDSCANHAKLNLNNWRGT